MSLGQLSEKNINFKVFENKIILYYLGKIIATRV